MSRLRPDQLLYDHFRTRLEKQIEAFGREKMAASVDLLRRLNEKQRKKCRVRPAQNLKGTKFAAVSENVIVYSVR